MINSPRHLCLSKSFPGLRRSHALSMSQFSKLKPLLSPHKMCEYNRLHPVFHPEFQHFVLPPWPGNWRLSRVLDSCHKTVGNHSRLLSDCLQSSYVRVKNCGSAFIGFYFCYFTVVGNQNNTAVFHEATPIRFMVAHVASLMLTWQFLTIWNCVINSDVCISLSIVQWFRLFLAPGWATSAGHGGMWKISCCHQPRQNNCNS